MTKKSDGLTPMMRQFTQLKAKHPDALMLFRCGDFYETYLDDAIEAARILGITLTNRKNGSGQPLAAMAGFPHHALDTYLPKLVRAGKRVAICDQLEDPKKKREEMKGQRGLSDMDKMVKRGITELVTPGVAMSDNVLNYKENNFLAAVHFGKAACGVAFLDISTGEFLTTQGSIDHVRKMLTNFAPKEVLHDRAHRADMTAHFDARLCLYALDDWVFTEQNARQKLLAHFGTNNLKGFGVDHLHEGVVAAGAIMQYLEITQHTNIGHITRLARIEEERFVRLDNYTIRSLELLEPMHVGGSSLLDVVDHTLTPMGGRMLRRWITFPLRNKKKINDRLDVVDCFFRSTELKHVLEDSFTAVGDIERIVSKVATMRVSPREVVSLRNALAALGPVKQTAAEADNDWLREAARKLDLCEELTGRIGRELRDDAPQQTSKGGMIAAGYNAELDELRDLAANSKDYLLKIQQREVQRTGISSLRVGFNNVFGYYLEVRNTFKDRVPDTWVRKQTLAQAERYITSELKEYEEKILGAEEKILSLESQLFQQLVQDMQAYIPRLQSDAVTIAQMDCLGSFAAVAGENRYVRPMVDEDTTIDIHQGRHPVIETQLPAGERYVPNDIYLDTTRQQIMIITGPNMAGKSALLRQTALIVLMAQMGCYVPAESAHVGLVDKVFTRVGASDNISLGESTFMVEMMEAADILNNCTPHSLVLFDELGRGTSTYDGISIAWAIVEYLHEHDRSRARTLFATHYHELNEMEKQFPRVKNFNVSVKEVDNKVYFLRKLVRGGSEHSFGIHVAEIAGMPKSIVRRAGVILRQLEADNAQVGSVAKNNLKHLDESREGMQLSFFQLDDPVLSQIRDEILGLDINNLTPVDALNKLNDIKKIVGGSTRG